MAIDSIGASNSSQITGAIQSAAKSTGTSFQYLLTTAQIESNLNPQARASTSTAQGLFQFIDQTWLATMKEQGPALGYGKLADAIVRTGSGYDVPDPTMRASIMKLRSDPAASSMMAGAFARNNAAQLSAALGRDPTEGELYIAHFLGSDGAGKLISMAERQPQTKGADLFPQAAAANTPIFYDRSGRALSVKEVYGKLTGRYENARAVAFNTPATNVAATTTVAITQVPDTAGIAEAYATANQGNQAKPQPAARSLMHELVTDRARQAVNQRVADLWTPQQGAEAAKQTDLRLSLFTDPKPGPRKPLRSNG
jgi:hypothetical protein